MEVQGRDWMNCHRSLVVVGGGAACCGRSVSEAPTQQLTAHTHGSQHAPEAGSADTATVKHPEPPWIQASIRLNRMASVVFTRNRTFLLVLLFLSAGPEVRHQPHRNASKAQTVRFSKTPDSASELPALHCITPARCE